MASSSNKRMTAISQVIESLDDLCHELARLDISETERLRSVIERRASAIASLTVEPVSQEQLTNFKRVFERSAVEIERLRSGRDRLARELGELGREHHTVAALFPAPTSTTALDIVG
jgi:hypothetical protein